MEATATVRKNEMKQTWRDLGKFGMARLIKCTLSPSDLMNYGFLQDQGVKQGVKRQNLMFLSDSEKTIFWVLAK